MASTPVNPRETPAMKQYFRFKERHPGCILLFRMGDFYEMFAEDAVTASKAIGLTLTQRTAGLPMAGMPYHQLDSYLRKFVAAGFRVAVCDQIQDPAEAKGLVERAVTRVITPGTLVDESLLADDAPNVIAAVCFPGEAIASKQAVNGTSAQASSPLAAVAVAELSTGAFAVMALAPEQVVDELARRRVCEVLYPETADGKVPPRLDAIFRGLNIAGTPVPQWNFRVTEAKEALCELFGVKSLAGFGLRDDDPLVQSAGAMVRYLRATQLPADTPLPANPFNSGAADRSKAGLSHLKPPKKAVVTDALVIDAVSLRALEIDRTIRAAPLGAGIAAARDGSLLGIFTTSSGRTLCRTSMGKRLLREWLCRPLREVGAINARQSCVRTLVEDRRYATELGTLIEPVQDVARIAARVALRRCTPRDIVALGRSLSNVKALAAHLASSPPFVPHAGEAKNLAADLDGFAGEVARLCVDEPPAHLREGGLIRDGVDKALDEVRTLKGNAAAWLADYQTKLIAEHNLPNLRVGFNRVFGYFIELPKAQSQRAPAVFTRRQTLTNAERYITPELKDFEDKVTHAETRAVEREMILFEGLCDRASRIVPQIGRFGDMIAALDVLLTLADKAVQRRWVAPRVVDEPVLSIKGGRHPVVEELLEQNFVPNDLELGGVEEDKKNEPKLALITGPNMAGKSTFIRQTALITILAHVGGFVPADSATIGVCDRVFTRVGADDALFAGQSTFMVEMTETANILHHATPHSLVILDEIGRGTSTLDGLSLAWAVAETLAGDAKHPGPRTLFATHYHEITQLQETMPDRVRNLHVAVREWQDQIVFLHRILPGRADRSYGIHVARLAGLPPRTIKRANEVLESLAVEHASLTDTKTKIKKLSAGAAKTVGPIGASNAASGAGDQLALFTEFLPHPAVDALKELKLDAMTPLQAFDELRRLRSTLEE